MLDDLGPTPDLAAAAPRDRLLALPAGMHHRARGGVWVMVGRALPAPWRWSSVPPARSLSLVWGAGGCALRHPGGAHALRPGELLGIEAGLPHRGEGEAGSDFLTLFLPAWTGPPAAAGAWVQPLSPALEAALLGLAGDVLSGRSPAARLAELRPLLPPPGALGPAPAPRPLRAARGVLDARYTEAVGLAELADASGARGSVSGLSRGFAKAWGIPPTHYRKQLRLLDATRRLLSGAPVAEAAAEAGFADGAHLSRVFRAQYGISPKAWQREVRPGLGPAALPRGAPLSPRSA